MRKWLSLLPVLLCFIYPFSVYGSDSAAELMQQTLKETEVNAYDSLQIALQFGLTDELPPLDLTPPPDWQPGMRRSFNVIDSAKSIVIECEAQIIYAGQHVVFWTDVEALNQVPAGLTAQMQRFDADVYPLMHVVFGSESNPGVDNDPRIHAVFTSKIGSGYSGYFSAQDEQDQRLYEKSNGMDLVFLNPQLFAHDAYNVIDTLAHEFQHMIHHAHDPNETVFLDEGLSGLAQYLSMGEITDSNIHAFLNNTDRSLINWPATSGNHPYYGSAFLFTMYLYDRLQPDVIRAIAASEENGLDSIDEILASWNGNMDGLDADKLYAEWVATLLLNLLGYDQTDYRYKTFDFPLEHAFVDIGDLPCEDLTVTHDAAQYGIDYYAMRCSQGRYEIRFKGQAETNVLNLSPNSGEYAWWTNAVNNSVTRLTREFDLTQVTGVPRLEYALNFEIEEDYDNLYLLASDDAGSTWQVLPTSSGTDENDSGMGLGIAYTGNSNGWLYESVDLSAYAGKRVTLQFVYVTDTASIAQGALIDDLRLDAIDYYTDLETDGGGWEADGFVRLYPRIPQRWLNVFMSENAAAPGGRTAYPPSFFYAEADEERVFYCDTTHNATGCFLAVSSLSRFAFSPASYSISVRHVE